MLIHNANTSAITVSYCSLCKLLAYSPTADIMLLLNIFRHHLIKTYHTLSLFHTLKASDERKRVFFAFQRGKKLAWKGKSSNNKHTNVLLYKGKKQI